MNLLFDQRPAEVRLAQPEQIPSSRHTRRKHKAALRLGWYLLSRALLLVIALQFAPGLRAERLRYIIETDAGGDPDDEQSLVRFLLYANEWDVEGIIANRPHARDGENGNPVRTGLGIVRRLINAYGKCYTNLVQHDTRYPKPEDLLKITVPGDADTEHGVQLLLAALERHDPRPIWFSNWGTDHDASQSCLKRALDQILRESGKEQYARLKSKLRLSSADAFGSHTTNVALPFTFWVDTFRPELEGRRWYHRFSALTARAGGFDLENDVRNSHGPLGALYPTNTTHPQKEGDSMCFIYLIPTGLGDPEEPGWGSWAGRYGPRDRTESHYYWANLSDSWHGTTNRDNTLARWAIHLQNDFKARMDWCVCPFQKANHPPTVLLNQSGGTSPIVLHAKAGSEVTLDASHSSDPDRNALRFDWEVYREAGTYDGIPKLSTEGAKATLLIPKDAGGATIHVIVSVTDSGQPPLTRYARAVIAVSDKESARKTLEPFFNPPEPFVGKFGSYRSPLLFEDGSTVTTARDWKRRRTEIFHQWQQFMGPWPPVIRKPKLQIISSSQREDLRQDRIKLEIAPGQTEEGWLLLPQNAHSAPAVLVVYYEPETSIGASKEPLRDFAYQLAKRGFVTLSIGTPGGNAWKPGLGAARCQPLSFHAYVAANCWHALARLPQVDSSRIGIAGHSYGGKWALFAAALWDKFAAVAVSDPGIIFDETRPNVNYWEPWYLGFEEGHQRKPGLPTRDNPATGAYKRLVESGHDLHELHALIAPRPLFVSGGAEDPPSRWLALNHLVALNTLLGNPHRVALTSRATHTPTPQSNEQLYAFFEYFLR